MKGSLWALLRLIFRVYYGKAASESEQTVLKNDHKAMIFLHTEKEPVHDYVRQTLFLSIKFAVYSF